MADPGFDLAVAAPFLGLPSETFVRRHAVDLAPGRTVALVTDMPRPGPDRWGGEVPAWVVRGRRLPGRRRMQVARRVARLGRRPSGRWRWAPTAEAERRLVEALDAAGVRAILVEFLDVWAPAASALRGASDRLVVHGHGYDVSSRLRDPWWRERYRVWDVADSIVVVAEHSRARLVACDLPADRIEVVPCGVDVPDGPPAPPGPSDTVDVLAVGRFVDKKGPLQTLAAFDMARRRAPDLRLTMIGDGPLLDAARRFVREQGLEPVVDLRGVQPPEVVARELAKSHLFVQHSVTVAATGEEEGLPVAVLEAMAAGVPVVATRHAGIPEAVVHDANGLLVDEHDVAGMADAIVTLARDEGLRRRYGLDGWQRAGDRFSATGEIAALRRLLGITPS